MQDFVEKLGLLTSRKLKSTVYEIILDKVPEEAENIRESLEDLIRSAEEDNLVKYKRITIQNEKGKKPSDYIVTKNKSCIPENEYDEDITYESFEQLQEEVKYSHKLKKLPNFFSKGDSSIIIKNIEGFLNTNGLIFVSKI